MRWKSSVCIFLGILLLLVSICIVGCDNRNTHTTQCPPTIQQGSQGSWVKALQQQLNTLGWRDQEGKVLGVDGTFGPRTDYAVESFQTKNDLSADGIVGPLTWAALGYC
jgi:peptidoglycan hydrolase-like protein with peptidoglycan-binding domain